MSVVIIIKRWRDPKWGGEQVAHGALLAHSGLHEHGYHGCAGVRGGVYLSMESQGPDVLGEAQSYAGLSAVGRENRCLCRLAGDGLGLLVRLLQRQAYGVGKGLDPGLLALVGVPLVVGGNTHHREAELQSLVLEIVCVVLGPVGVALGLDIA